MQLNSVIAVHMSLALSAVAIGPLVLWTRLGSITRPQLRMVPVANVLRLEAADKYVRVLTADGTEVLLRTPLKELIQRLDAQVFWQIHRGSVVRATAIESVNRDESGRLSLRLKGHSEKLGVSRLYAHLFKAM